MLKMLIVDDEYYFRKGFRVIIPFEDCGFTICGEARNGEEALERLEELEPDVVFVDVNMPVMDGLDFVASARARGYDTIFVMLTGYSEFSYAQKAMQLGVSRYLLKPVNEEELKDTLRSLKDNIENTKRFHLELSSLRDQAEQNIPILRDRYLGALLRGAVSDKEPEILQRLNEYEVRICSDHYAVALLGIDVPTQQSDDDYSLWRYAVINIANEMFEDKGIDCICREGDDTVCVLLFIEGCNTESYSRVCCIFEEIIRTIRRYFDFSVTIGIGSLKDNLSDIALSYEEALFALRNKITHGKNLVITYDMVDEIQIYGSFYTTERRSEMLINLRLGDLESAIAIVDSILNRLQDRNANLNMLSVTCVEILSTCLEYLNEAGQGLPELLRKNDIINKLLYMSSLAEMRAWLLELLQTSVELVLRNRTDKAKGVAEEIKRHIEENYCNFDFKINDIAQSLHISYGHLCYIFKRETGKTINGYLSEFRLEKAKEMLDDGYTYILDIAEKCGYSDQGYFSKCFKKAYGVAPRRYAKSVSTE